MSSATDFSSKRRGAAPRLSRLFDLLAPILAYCLHAHSTTVTGTTGRKPSLRHSIEALIRSVEQVIRAG
jgi:hypothetical protein